MKYFSEFIQKLIRSSTYHTTNLFIGFQGSIFNGFGDILLTRFYPYFFGRAISQEMGIILKRKKICISYLFMRNLCIKFKTLACTVQKLCYSSKKHAMQKCPKLQRAIIHEVFFRIYTKVNQVIYSSIPIY